MVILSKLSSTGNTQVLFKSLPQPTQRGPHVPPKGLNSLNDRLRPPLLCTSAFQKEHISFIAPLPSHCSHGRRRAPQARPALAAAAARSPRPVQSQRPPAALTTLVRISCRRGEALASTTRLLTSFPSTGFNTMVAADGGP